MNTIAPFIRQATKEDVPLMFEIRVSVRENSTTRERLYALGINDEAVANSITNEGRGWIAEENGQAVGFSMADLRDGSIFALFVRPEFERRGYGGALLAAAVRWLLSRNFKQLWLAVGRDTRAHRFYLKRGWVETGVIENGDVELRWSCS